MSNYTYKHYSGAILALVATLGGYVTLNPDSQVASVIGFSQQIGTECLTTIQEQYKVSSRDELKTTQTELNGDRYDDLIVRIENNEQCGSTGCVYELCLSTDSSDELSYETLGFAANSVEVSSTRTNGMRDLLLISNNNETVLRWQNSRYIAAY